MKNNERKDQLIKAASKRFSKLGYYKTTLEEVARDIRIGKATIYHYFQSKDELYNDVLEWESNYVIEKIKDIFNDETIEILDRFLRYFELKHNIISEDKIISLLFVKQISSELNEKESEIIKKLIDDETKILSLVMNFLNRERIEKYDERIPKELVYLSWMVSIINNKINKNESDKKLFSESRIKSIIRNYLD
jgi:AcrR family transcriptional regulator